MAKAKGKEMTKEEPILTDWPPPTEAQMKYHKDPRYPYEPPKVPYGYPYHLLTGADCDCEGDCLPLNKRPEDWRAQQRSEWWIGDVMVSPQLPEPTSMAEVMKMNIEVRRGAPKLLIVTEGLSVERDKELIEEFQQEALFTLLGAG